MKKVILIASMLLSVVLLKAQYVYDTIAIQDFDNGTPNWNYTGTLAGTQSGYASTAASVPSTPLGVGGSTAWHVVSVSGGNPIVFNNTSIPSGYDSVFVSFQLAGLNLSGSAGGPDNLDYVLVEYSTDGGVNYTSRVRVRGAVNNNSSWPYNATGQAVVYYLPATESVFQPTNSGLQMTAGISYVQIGFPGSTSQIAVRITPRSSSSTDDWLIDNVLLRGRVACNNTSSSITYITCDSYTAPSGAVFTSTGTHFDTIPNSTGCDSIITVNLTVYNSTSATDQVVACDSYTWIDGNTYTSNNNTASYTLTNSTGCDSVVTLDLTINSPSYYTDSIVACDSYTWIDSITYTESNDSATYTLTNAAGCDSVVTLNLTINSVEVSVNNVDLNTLEATTGDSTASYLWYNCFTNEVYTNDTLPTYTATISGDYAVVVTSANTCSDSSECLSVIGTGINTQFNKTETAVAYPNPSNGNFTLLFDDEIKGASIVITNISGQVVYNETLGVTKQHEIHFEQPNGIYFCKISTDDQSQQVIRIIKQ